MTPEEQEAQAQAEWRKELLRLYDVTYAKKHGLEPPEDDPPPPGGVREPRRPRPSSPAGEAEEKVSTPLPDDAIVTSSSRLS